MSGCSYDTECPNCGKSADAYIDRKPFDYTKISCPFCGLQIYPVIVYMTLEELNQEREECFDLEPLKVLPKQSFKWE